MDKPHTDGVGFNLKWNIFAPGLKSPVFNRLYVIFAVLFFYAVASATAYVDSSESTEAGSPASPSKTSIFNDLKLDAVANLEFEDLKKDWFQAPVTEKGGMFNPVFLPFQYVCLAGDADVKQPMTFPCLLSFKFDFVPDNFSARHPAFIYRKRPIWNVKPNQPEKIADYVEYWEATHAVGGRLTQHEDGYTGRLLVFDSTGAEILNQQYTEPVPYFTLMGQMVKTWMEFREQDVSDGLYKEMIRPMTNDMECVRLYGQSFYMPWRTDKEWAVYDEILQRDPDFAEVRFWYANQKGWTLDDGDPEFTQLKVEKGKALQSHLLMPALDEFDFDYCPDKQVVSDCKKVLAYAERICGEDSTVMSVKLEVEGKHLSIEELDTLLPIAEKYPSGWNFIQSLAWEYHQRGCYEKSIPLYLSAINSGYLKGVGRFDWEWSKLAQDFLTLGFPDESIHCVRHAFADCAESRKPYVSFYAGKALRERNHFDSATRSFIYRQEKKEDSWGAFYAYLSMYEDGDLTLQDKLKERTIKYKSMDLLRKTRSLQAEGNAEEALKLLKVARVLGQNKSRELRLETEMMLSDLYNVSGQMDQAAEHAVAAWYLAPRNRHAAYLLEHSVNEDNLADFQRYLTVGLFICENDACWKAMLDRLEGRLPAETTEDVTKRYQAVKDKLDTIAASKEADFKQQIFPFEVESVCLDLLRQDDESMRDKSLRLYLQYRDLVKGRSEWQKAHTRLFFIQLLQQIPENDRPAWMALINEETK